MPQAYEEQSSLREARAAIAVAVAAAVAAALSDVARENERTNNRGKREQQAVSLCVCLYFL